MDAEILRQVVDKLLQVAPRGSKVVVFGSHARGTANAGSDLDLLVIEPSVRDRFGETFRLRKALEEVFVDGVQPVDLVVTDQASFDATSKEPNSLAHEAMSHGRLYA